MQLHQIFRSSSNPVVMAGDSHNAWAYNLLDPNTSLPLAVEFDDASVTPPGLDELDQVIPGMLHLYTCFLDLLHLCSVLSVPDFHSGLVMLLCHVGPSAQLPMVVDVDCE